jgi:hypothetical protein
VSHREIEKQFLLLMVSNKNFLYLFLEHSRPHSSGKINEVHSFQEIRVLAGKQNHNENYRFPPKHLLLTIIGDEELKSKDTWEYYVNAMKNLRSLDDETLLRFINKLKCADSLNIRSFIKLDGFEYVLQLLTNNITAALR